MKGLAVTQYLMNRLDVRSYSRCIVGSVRFHMLECDSQHTTQNSWVMVIGEGSGGSANNNFYSVLDEVLHVQYPFGRRAWLFMCRWFDTDKNKSHRTHEELGYKSINTSRFLFAEEPLILATQAHQVFYLEDPKNGINWKIFQVVQNKRVWDVPEVEDIENNQLNVMEIVVEHRVDEHIIEDDALCRTEVDPTIVERSNVYHVVENFINDEDDEQSSHQSESCDDE